MERVPATRSDYTLLILLYWSIFDGIDIPKDLMNIILEKGTEPETISRARRKLIEVAETRASLLEAFKEVENNGKRTDKG